MYTIQVFNSIAEPGLRVFPDDQYAFSTTGGEPDAVLLRSHDLHSTAIPERVVAIARCGAGVNNIPVDACSERGIAVFNTPGANANSVKELVLCGLLLSSRRIVEGIAWARSLRGQDVAKTVETHKKRFAGPEIAGKTLGVIGLGAIGVAVANVGPALGMRTVGYDPFLSVHRAWGLDRQVIPASSLQELIAQADYITVHAPLNDHTRDLIGASEFGSMKPGVRLLNFARGPLVNETAILEALSDGTCACYVTDFLSPALVRNDRVVPVPHLGASTPEAEVNCAVMAARQLRDYLESGIVNNSVNFPTVLIPMRPGSHRIQMVNRNEPNMISQLAAVVASCGLNIDNLVNKGRGKLAYNVLDVSESVPAHALESLRRIDGVIRVRTLKA